MLFPSPAGVFFISSKRFKEFDDFRACFRPLPGSFLFHHIITMWKQNAHQVSVPCRGLFYFIEINTEDYICPPIVSVPCRGLFYFILGYTLTQKNSDCLFPSPAGVFFISSVKTLICQEVFWLVSVPGVFFISSSFQIYTCDDTANGFRPLPGSFLFHQLQN